nr:protein phosphatase CheZ [uncultured Cohaesibacter sp.]
MPPSPLRQEDYLAIESAVMETARGRWFLAEYARRNRNADTDTLLTAIDKLEKTIVRERAPSSLMHQVRMDLADMASAIDRTKKEIAQIKHEDNEGSERFERATMELDAIVSQTESATGDILSAAEKIQEFAWTLREQGADNDKCDELDMEATNIYMACSFQDLTGQRIRKIVDAMRYVESRINSMIDIWGFESDGVEVDQNHHRSHDVRPDAHLLNGPALAGEGVDQGDVDMLFDNANLHEQADQDDVDALFDNAPTIDNEADDLPEEMSQDAADALFATDSVSSDEDEVDLSEAEDASEAAADVEEEFVEDAEFEAVAEDEAAAEDAFAAEVDDNVSEEAASESENVVEDATDAEEMVSVQDGDVEFVDMQDLDWASASEASEYLETVEPEAQQETEAASEEATEVEATSELDDFDALEVEAEGDVFETASADDEDGKLEAAGEVDPEAESDAEMEAMMDGEADIFASADVFDSALDEELASSDEQEEEPMDLRDRVAQFS